MERRRFVKYYELRYYGRHTQSCDVDKDSGAFVGTELSEVQLEGTRIHNGEGLEDALERTICVRFGIAALERDAKTRTVISDNYRFFEKRDRESWDY